MKLTKENIYINLQSKSKEELTELYWLLKNNNQDLFHNDLSVFIKEYYKTNRFLEYCNQIWQGGDNSKTEVTIEQLKEILQPMGTFKPIAMRCTQEQFEAIKPKLDNEKSLRIFMFNKKWDNFYLALFKDGSITNGLTCGNINFEIHEEWNEEIFLKACGIEGESLEKQLEKSEEILTLENVQVNSKGLTDKEIINISDIIYNKKGTRPILTINGYIIYNYQSKKTTITYDKFMELFGNKETLQEKEQRLIKELEEVKQQIEEENKPKVGDWVVVKDTSTFFKVKATAIKYLDSRHEKITNPQLIILLEQETK